MTVAGLSNENFVDGALRFANTGTETRIVVLRLVGVDRQAGVGPIGGEEECRRALLVIVS